MFSVGSEADQGLDFVATKNPITSGAIHQILPCLRWGWVFLEPMRILRGIHFEAHFIDFLVVQTKQFGGGSLNVMLSRQSWCQRSSLAAESKRRALGN